VPLLTPSLLASVSSSGKSPPCAYSGAAIRARNAPSTLICRGKPPWRSGNSKTLPVFREGIAAVLSLEPDIEMVAEAQTAAEAVALFREHRPDIVLMDIKLPDGSGVDATAQICREFPRARVIMLTTYKGDVQALKALKAGAWGFLLKNTVRRELVESIRMVHRGQQRVKPSITPSSMRARITLRLSSPTDGRP
jgi:DNA-binding NarL/FixJ family response regulator